MLKRPEFDEYRERLGLEYLGKREQPKPAKRIDSPGWATFIEALAQFLRILAYAAIALAVVFLLYYLLRRFDLLGRERSSYVPPATLFGLDVRPESLPDDVAAAALELARAGELLKALSLLYRGALVTLLHRDGVELASGDTEDDCLRKSRQHIPDPSLAYFARLLAAWQRLAYARREVPRAEVETLCGDWRAHFAASEPGSRDMSNRAIILALVGALLGLGGWWFSQNFGFGPQRVWVGYSGEARVNPLLRRAPAARAPRVQGAAEGRLPQARCAAAGRNGHSGRGPRRARPGRRPRAAVLGGARRRPPDHRRRAGAAARCPAAADQRRGALEEERRSAGQAARRGHRQDPDARRHASCAPICCPRPR